MDNQTTPKRPSYNVFYVEKLAGDKVDWHEIGAAWPHKNGQGHNLSIKLIPAGLKPENMQDFLESLVLLTPKEKKH